MQQQAKSIPKYFDLLSPSDQNAYHELREMLSSNICRNNRNRRVETFSDILRAIKLFCYHSDDAENNWIRCLVAGIVWLPGEAIGLNIRQFRILIDKCKSTINGSLTRLGYTSLPPHSETLNKITTEIPFLKGHYEELREWTIRVKIEQNSVIPQAPVAMVALVTPVYFFRQLSSNQIYDNPGETLQRTISA